MRLRTETSIRLQLLHSLLVPLYALWLISMGIGYYLSVQFANDAYDRELVNTADSVAARMRTDGKRVWTDMPPAAQAILRYDDSDNIYYQVLEKDGSRIFGDAVLPGPLQHLDAQQPVLRNAKLNGESIRIARIRARFPKFPDRVVLVQVAETLNSRRLLTQQILLSIAIPQVALIILGAIAVWRGVSKGMNPINSLEDAISKRSPNDLTPVSARTTPIELCQLVNSINSLFHRLEEDLEGQRRFVANAAHQFRTPLASLKTYIYMAKKLPAAQDMNDMLDRIDNATNRMTHLSMKLLALAKADPSNMTENLRPVDLNFIVSETTASLAPDATLKNQALSFAGSNAPAIIMGDPSSLRELTANLIENALLYTPECGQISVSVSCSDQVKLTVCDNGYGIPAEERERVFERFYRILGSTAPGSGLGLPIVKEIATAHNASVSVDGGPGGLGTSVTVVFRPTHSSLQQ